MRMNRGVAFLLAMGAGCAAPATTELPYTKVDPGKEDSSAEAVFLDFEFDGELVTDVRWGDAQQVEEQLLYTMGQLNGTVGVARLDRVALSDVRSERATGDQVRISYHATLPVAWGRREAVPNDYTLRLPRDMSSAGLARFFEKYKSTCVDSGAHDPEAGNFWYYYRPERRGCTLDPSDVVSSTAVVARSEINTTGRFPEYDKVWEDDTFRAVAIFGKYEDGARDGDAGVFGYNRFLREMQVLLEGRTVTTVPETLPASPGVDVPDVTFRADLGNGRSLEVVALLVDNVREGGPAFDARYAELSTRADFIVYNGHAGLGANVQALARKGEWTQGQYAIVMMNGCDTYAYVDDALWNAHARVNPDDATGTKYLDIVTNAMPAYFSEMPKATMAFIKALLDVETPRTYEQIFAGIDSSQVVLVSGEQDNAFVPGSGTAPTPPDSSRWTGLSESGHLAAYDEAKFTTPTLRPGRYRFALSGTGDADLYVRIGSEPTASAYDCRPYKSDSNETCEVELPQAAAVHLSIDGYTASTFTLRGEAL
jgi:hypothetical protein